MGELVERFYSKDELKNALIVDSEGLIYGFLEDYFVEGGRVYIKAYVTVEAEELYVDYEKLFQAIRKRGVEVSENAPLEILVSTARELGLDIPYRRASKRIRLVKGIFLVEEVKWISSATFVKETGEEEKKTVVLLKTPREAKYRGARKQKEPVLSEESIRGKLVVSLSKGVLGYAGELVVGFGRAGLRVYRKLGGRKYVNWLKFITELRRRRFVDLAEKLAEYADPYKESKLPLSKLSEVEEILRNEKVSEEVFQLLQSSVYSEAEEPVYRDVPLDSILKIREVIIVE
ncbi:MAG TPA: hypothetical protein ENF55_01580 [Thermoprotei archaeon]|nr:hypothetical protein [Thermoprotei archaeon]